MTTHVGVDAASGVDCSAQKTPANVSDLLRADALLAGLPNLDVPRRHVPT